jgi:NAD(P)-dependent dehydrogenase (short-subunit alcohol dehydrogenase family)
MKRIIMITGATGGLGLAMAQELAQQPWDLILTSRNAEKGAVVQQQLMDENPQASLNVIQLDLASFASIDAGVAQIYAKYDHIDVLFNNAGLYMDHAAKTADGFEMTVGVNHVGPVYLTERLLPLIRHGRQPQILQMCSRAALIGRYRDRPDLFERHPYGFRAYAASKLMQLRQTLYWADVLAADGIAVNAVHPGVVATGIWRGESLLMRFLAKQASRRYLPADEAAKSGLCLIERDDLRQVTGRFFEQDGVEITLNRAIRDPQRIEQLARLTRSAILAKGGDMPSGESL